MGGVIQQKELCQFIHISESTAYRYRRSGIFKWARENGRVYIDVHSVMVYMLHSFMRYQQAIQRERAQGHSEINRDQIESYQRAIYAAGGCPAMTVIPGPFYKGLRFFVDDNPLA
jgi:hypothetical protein